MRIFLDWTDTSCVARRILQRTSSAVRTAGKNSWYVFYGICCPTVLIDFHSISLCHVLSRFAVPLVMCTDCIEIVLSWACNKRWFDKALLSVTTLLPDSMTEQYYPGFNLRWSRRSSVLTAHIDASAHTYTNLAGMLHMHGSDCDHLYSQLNLPTVGIPSEMTEV